MIVLIFDMPQFIGLKRDLLSNLVHTVLGSSVHWGTFLSISHSVKRLLLLAALVSLGACQSLSGASDAIAVISPEAVVEEKPEDQPFDSSAELPSDIPVQVCECPDSVEVITPQQCSPAPPAIITRAQCDAKFPNDLLVIGRVEKIYLLSEKKLLKARIDTGAGISSLHAVDIKAFDRDGKPWVRFRIPMTASELITVERPIKRLVEIKQLAGESQRRPIVIMSLRLGSIEEQVEMTLSDRTDFVYPILIGRNFLRDRAIVDVSRKYVIKTLK